MSINQETVRPPETPGPITWIRQNLFNNWFNSLLTVGSLIFILWFGGTILRWVLYYTDWRPVTEYPLLFMVGQYPRELLLRIGLSLGIISFLMGVSWGVWRTFMESFAITLGALLAIAALMPIHMDEITLGMRVFMGLCVGLIFLGFFLARKIRITGRILAIAWIVILLVIVLMVLPGFGPFPHPGR